MKKTIPLLLFLNLLSWCLWAQNPAQNGATRIQDEFYNNKHLDFVLLDLESKYDFKFEFDGVALNQQLVTFWFKKTTITDGLKKLIKEAKLDLKFYVNATGTIVIVPKDQKVEEYRIGELRPSEKPAKFDFTLSGKLVDSQTGESLPFANIRIRRDNRLVGTQTNVDGFFTLFNVPTDTTALYVSYVGYQPRTYHLSPALSLQNFTISLDAEEHLLTEVVVSGNKTEVVKANEVIGMIKMTPKNLAKLPNVGERDPFRAFQLMPGVSASNESSSGLYVRGGTPDQTLVLYDGFTVYHVDHLFGFFSAFNYNAIKDIQLYKGGFDAKYGGRISAVAEITGKDGNNKEFNAGADVSLLSTNAFVEVPIGGKVTLLAAGRRSWKGPLYKKIFDRLSPDPTQAQPTAGGVPGGGRRFAAAQTQQQTASSYFYDLNGKITFRPTTKDILSLSFYNGTDNMDNSTTSSFAGGGGFGGGGGRFGGLNTSTSDLSQWGNVGSSLKWSRMWSNRLYSNSLLSYSNYFSDRDNSRNITITRNTGETQNVRVGQLENNNLYDMTAKVDFELKLNQSNQVDFGIQYTRNQIQYSYKQNDTTSVLDRDDTGSTFTGYVQDQFKFYNSKIIIKPGLRLTYFDVTSKSYLEPRLSAYYQLSDRIKLKGAAGTYYQFVKQINREDITQGNRNFWILSNAGSLPVTKSDHLILGGSYENKNYLLDVEFYQKKNSGITEYTLRFVPQLRQGLTADETFFTGTELIQGVDVLLQRKFGNITGWVGYTLAEAKRNIAEFSDKPYYSDQDVRHQLKLVGMYQYKKWDLAATWIFSTGRPYTSIIGAYQLTLLDGTTRDFTNPSDKNANRFDHYHRMDVSATFHFTRQFSVGLSVFNLYNRTNTWYKRFEVTKEDDLSILQTTNVNYLGITPNIILSWKLK